MFPNDYWSLKNHEQYQQTKRAIFVFQIVELPYHDLRNPYLGWTEESLDIFTVLGFIYLDAGAFFFNSFLTHTKR